MLGIGDVLQEDEIIANDVASKINEANHTSEKPFKLGYITGSFPLEMYRELIALNKEGKFSFKNVITFN